MLIVPISKNLSVMIDVADAELVSHWSWSAHKSGKRIYAKRNKRMPDGSRKYVYMHREIMDAPDGMVVDHINGNTFDNQKSNLRVCSQAKNTLNKHKALPKSKSGILGVFFREDIGKWSSQITVNGKTKTLGCFSSKEEAAAANRMARRDALNA